MGIADNITTDVSNPTNEKYIQQELDRDEFSRWIADPFKEQLSSLWNRSNDLLFDHTLFGRFGWQPRRIYPPVDAFGSSNDNGSSNGGDYVREDQIKEEGVTGLYSYGSPTDSQFSACMEADGLSVWNTRGWWRCLFPESLVREKLPNLTESESQMILTKEKMQNDYANKFGLYFTDYSKYLLWRSQISKEVEKRRTEQRLKLQSERQQQIEEQADSNDRFPLRTDRDIITPETVMLGTHRRGLGTTDARGKKVVGTSESFSSDFTNEGGVEIRETRTYYDDGSTLLQTKKKTFPKEGGKPVVEKTEKWLNKGDNDDDDDGNGRSGRFPFWGRK